MVGVVRSIPSGDNFIFTDFETPRCQFCTKMPEMSDLCYLGKTRLKSIHRHGMRSVSLEMIGIIRPATRREWKILN